MEEIILTLSGRYPYFFSRAIGGQDSSLVASLFIFPLSIVYRRSPGGVPLSFFLLPY